LISSTQNLPRDYIQTHEINLKKSPGLAVILNIAGVFVFFISFWLLGKFAAWVHPGLIEKNASFTVNLSTIGYLLALLLLAALTLGLHELIHGFFFWVFTRSKPVYALRLTYAYAAAPNWFIPSRQYWIIGLAPLIIIAAIGLWVIIIVPPNWILAVIFLLSLNTGGAVGDMLIIAQLFRLSPACLVKDSGDGVCYFETKNSELRST
jgi:hypothetical protein